MGFLQQDTNNIIVDAVLTDVGRQKLAAGTFNVIKFAAGDDEVDYGMIVRYGRTVGQEKIEKKAAEKKNKRLAAVSGYDVVTEDKVEDGILNIEPMTLKNIKPSIVLLFFLFFRFSLRNNFIIYLFYFFYRFIS